METINSRFLEPAHFVAFRISPGLHVLSAASWMNSHSKPGAHIIMNIGSGQQYFLPPPRALRNLQLFWRPLHDNLAVDGLPHFKVFVENLWFS
jgi:hypothetical protein